MPIIENSAVPMSPMVDYARERTLVSSEQGALSQTIKEVELHPGWEGRLHTHTTDTVVMVMSGAVQIILEDELTTVRAGVTLVVPPGVPHKLANKLWIPVRLLVIYPTIDLETSHLE